MNDLTEYELLSAYLDGELSAAERQSVERMLAADPAARRLLNQLRELSGAIQSMPRQSLGADISEQVLFEAERRRSAQVTPSEAESMPVPLSRSIFRRLANRRGLAWASVAVAVAIMIVVTQQQPAGRQQARNMQDQQLANEPAQPAKAAAERLEVEKAPASAAAPATTAPLFELSPQQGGKDAEAAKPHATDAADRAPLRPAAAAARAKGDGEETQLGISPDDAFQTERKQKSGPADRFTASAEQGQQVMVVQCEVSPEAAKQQAFDKLLSSNGIVWQAEDEPPLADEAKEQAEGLAKRQSAKTEDMEPIAGERETDFVYVEATPQQVAATLEGLAASPTSFRNIVVAPAEGAVAQNVKPGTSLRFSYGADQPAAQAPMQLHQAEPPAVQLQGNAQRIRLPSDAAGQQLPATQLDRRQLVEASGRQQVLFVLRVGGDGGGAAQPIAPPAAAPTEKRP